MILLYVIDCQNVLISKCSHTNQTVLHYTIQVLLLTKQNNEAVK